MNHGFWGTTSGTPGVGGRGSSAPSFPAVRLSTSRRQTPPITPGARVTPAQLLHVEPHPGPAQAEPCPRCAMPLDPDVETYRVALLYGDPDPPRILTCRNAHSLRLNPSTQPPRPAGELSIPCAGCGGPLHRGKAHRGACAHFIQKMRWRAIRSKASFELARQPWYRGPDRAAERVVPVEGRVLPRTWLEGYQAIYLPHAAFDAPASVEL